MFSLGVPNSEDRGRESYWLGLATGVLSKYGYSADAERLFKIAHELFDRWEKEDQSGQS